MTGAGPLAVAAARLSIAALVLLVVAAVAARRSGSAPPPARARELAVAGFALAVHFGSWIASLQYATVAVSTLLVATTPIWTALFEATVQKRKLGRPTLLAFAGGAAGLAMVVRFDASPPPDPGHPLLGAALALLGGFAMAVYLLLVRRARRTLRTRAVVTRTYAWAAAALVVAAAIVHQPPPPIQDVQAWGGILGMALVSQLLGHTALNASLRWFSPSAVAFSTLVEPIAAALLAYALFRESLGPVALAGGAILLASIGMVLNEERGA